MWRQRFDIVIKDIQATNFFVVDRKQVYNLQGFAAVQSQQHEQVGLIVCHSQRGSRDVFASAMQDRPVKVAAMQGSSANVKYLLQRHTSDYGILQWLGMITNAMR